MEKLAMFCIDQELLEAYKKHYSVERKNEALKEVLNVLNKAIETNSEMKGMVK